MRKITAMTRYRIFAAAATFAVANVGVVKDVVADEAPKSINIPAQDLMTAIDAFGKQTKQQVTVNASLIEGKRSNAVSGVMTPEDALDQLLDGTGLTTQSLGDDGALLWPSTTDRVTKNANEEPVDLGSLVLTGEGGFDAFEEKRTIETLTSEDLERRNIDTLASALETTPNVFVTGQSDPLTFDVTIRGISDVGNVNTTGPTVGYFVDGVLLNQVGSAASFNPSLIDSERVDVFLGPQTTTFGRSTTAGAVNIVTKKPTDEIEYELRGDLGYFDGQSALFGSSSFVANAPLLDDGLLSARLVGFVDGSEGFVSVFNDPDGDNLSQSSYGGRLSLRSRPTNDLTFDLQLSYTQTEFDASNFYTSVDLVEQGEYVTFVDPAGKDTNEDLILRFEAQYDTDMGTFSSNTSYRFSETIDDVDGDFVGSIDLVQAGVLLRTRSFSQDFTFQGVPFSFPGLQGDLTLSGGASFNYNEFKTSDTVLLAGGLGDLVTDDRQDALNIGLYAEAEWAPTSKLTVSAGLRYSYDHIDSSDVTYVSGPGVDLGFLEGFDRIDGSATFNSIVPTAAISYDWSSDLTTFVSYSVGYRPGGTSEVGTGQGTTLDFFDEEITRSFELGLRSSFFEDRLFVKATAFYTQIDDFQAPFRRTFPGTAIPPSIVLLNAGDAESYGGELTITARPQDGLLLQASAGLNFTEITSFNADNEGLTGDLTGSSLPNAPEFTFTFTGEYEHPTKVLGDFTPYFGWDYSIRSDFISGLNNPEIDGFDILDIRLGLRGERLNFEFFAENLLDEHYVTSRFESPFVDGPIPFASTGLPPVALGDVGTPGRPRRIGFRMKMVF